jgi:adenine phosphoribosyltransferase
VTDVDQVPSLVRSLVRDVKDFPSPGILFRDLTPVFADPHAFRAVVDWIAQGASDIDAVVGIEARGFMLAAPVALALGVGFVPVRKAGKLPSTTHAVSYALEYGEAVLEIHDDPLPDAGRVLVVDDVLATGGTLAATLDLVSRVGGSVVDVAVIIEIAALGGRERLRGVPLRSLWSC